MKPGALIHGAVGPVIFLAAAAIITMVSIDNGERQYRAAASVDWHAQPYSLDRNIAAVPVSSDPISGLDALDAFIPTEARFGGLPFDVPPRHAQFPNSYCQRRRRLHQRHRRLYQNVDGRARGVVTMKPGALILGAAVSIILLVAAGILYLMANDNSAQHYRRSISVVQQIQQLSSDWSIELTRVKSDPLADFDSLASFIPRMARHKILLSVTAHNIPDLPDRLANAINAYINAVDAKEERVERFKTGYAVVRNSVRYLPLAAANVLQLTQNSEDRSLAQSISNLVQEIELYIETPTKTSQARLLADIENLRKASVAYPTALANTLANLFSHAEVLITKQRPTEELFREATSPQISNLTNELTKQPEVRARETGGRAGLLRSRPTGRDRLARTVLDCARLASEEAERRTRHGGRA